MRFLVLSLRHSDDGVHIALRHHFLYFNVSSHLQAFAYALLELSELQLKSNLELLAEIDKMMLLPDEEISITHINSCLDILQECAPIITDYDPMVTLENLRHKYPHIFTSTTFL